MGSTLARALAAAGLNVTARSGTSDKARALESASVRAAATLEEAVAPGSIVVICVRNYEVTSRLLANAAVERAPAGKVVVQRSTGTLTPSPFEVLTGSPVPVFGDAPSRSIGMITADDDSSEHSLLQASAGAVAHIAGPWFAMPGWTRATSNACAASRGRPSKSVTVPGTTRRSSMCFAAHRGRAGPGSSDRNDVGNRSRVTVNGPRTWTPPRTRRSCGGPCWIRTRDQTIPRRDEPSSTSETLSETRFQPVVANHAITW